MTVKILVVDDSLMVRNQVTRALEGAGIAVIEAIDGSDALEKLATHPDTKLLLVDVNMPRMGGLELLEQANANGSKVPVVMLTTERQPGLIQRATDLGAKGWIVKPFKPEHLLAAVKKLTEGA